MAFENYDINEISLRRTETKFLRQAVRASWVILFFAIVYQLIFFAEITNIVAMAAVVFAWLITTKTWLRPELLERYLISTFMILGFAASQFFFPLLFTTIENKPLIHNLELPEEVFLHSTLGLLVLGIAHALYRFLMRYSLNRSYSLFDKAGFFTPPSHLQLWVMGAIGMLSSFYVYFTAPDIGREITGSASDKLVQGLVPFSYAPFFIPLAKLYGNNEKTHRGFSLMIIAYSLILFAVSMARNSRGAFIFGLTNPAFAYALGLLLGVFYTKILTFRNVVVVGLLGWLLVGPFTDLGTAMLIVREKRTDIPPMELVQLTLETYDDKKALEARAKGDKEESMDFDWDERYLDNIFTARFANIKFNDASLITYSKVGKYDPDMQQFSIDFLIASLPDPVIKLFGFDVDKELVVSLSFGDFLYILSGGYGTPFGYRVGHIAGTGMAAYGWWYLLLLGLVAIPIFYLNEKFFRRKKGAELLEAQTPEERFKFSFCGVLQITSFFQFFVFESVVNGAIYLIRGWIQIVILYFLIFHLSRLLSILISGRPGQLRLGTTD
jgi:hypothetical protein